MRAIQRTCTVKRHKKLQTNEGTPVTLTGFTQIRLSMQHKVSVAYYSVQSGTRKMCDTV